MVPKYSTKRARVHFEEYGSGILTDVFRVESFTINIEEGTVELESTNEVRGILKREIISTKATGTITLSSTHFENMVMALRGKVSAQAAAANGTFTFPALKKGQSFRLPHGKITAIAVDGMSEGVDFQCFNTSGIVTALRDVTAPLEGGTYSAGTARVAGFAAGANKVFTIHVTDELNGEYSQWFRCEISLPKSVEYVKPNEFGALPLELTFYLDETRSLNGDYGQYGYLLED